MAPRRLLVSFSGGETSALMTKLLLEQCAHEYDEVRVVFANTGEEYEKTLEFVHQCDIEFDFNVRWIEAVTPSERGVGARCREVTFETASRRGEPFEEMIAKHGIPNPAQPVCSKELKSRPITRWAREQGWLPGSYDLAVGIRSDEIDRMSPEAKKRRIIYPLVSRFPQTKATVSEFWSRQPFRLGLKSYQGNCKWCWKKSLRKHITIMREDPAAFEFPERMERLYPMAGANKTGEPRRFFRGNRTVDDLRQIARSEKIAPAVDEAREYQTNLIEWLDADLAACGSETCEVDFAVA